MRQSCFLAIPTGYLLLVAEDAYVTSIRYQQAISRPIERSTCSVFTQAQFELKQYLSGNRFQYWHFPVRWAGTPFQLRVWNELVRIPFGQTRYYSEIAQQLNTSARAVANACRANPLAIVIPCHRVIAKSGFGGYYGATQGRLAETKRWLLNHEQNTDR